MAATATIDNPMMRVWCQCCQKPADFFEANFDCYHYRWEVHISCHGKKDHQTLDQLQIEQFQRYHTTVFAFTEDAARLRELERNKSKRLLCL